MEVDPKIEKKFSKYLEPDEKVLWTGRGGRNSPTPFPVYIVGTLMLGFMVFGFLPSLFPTFVKLLANPSVWALVFVAVVLFMVLSFVLPTAAMARQFLMGFGKGPGCFYLVTSKHAISRRAFVGEKPRLVEITGATSVDRRIGRDGSGDVCVGCMVDEVPPLSITAFVSDRDRSRAVGGAVIFRGIPDAESVYQLALGLRHSNTASEDEPASSIVDTVDEED